MSADSQLMTRLIGGDQAALKSLYDAYGPALYVAALRIVGDRGIAEEVMQDSFFQLWRKAAQFDSARGSLIGWLLTIARRRAISRIRGAGEQARLESLSTIGDIERADVGSSLLEQHIAHQLVSAALGDLSHSQREALTLAYFEGMTCGEIATRTGAALGTVKGRLRSATQKARRSLSEPNDAASTKLKQPSVGLCDILITDQLFLRRRRKRDPEEERNALEVLRLAAAAGPHHLIEAFLRMPTDLCHAGSGGLSLLETGADGKQVFRWTHVTGRLQKYVGGTTPRNFSPCGVTLDRNAAQLFTHQERYFDYFRETAAVLPLEEVLVIPFRVGAETEGTVWIVSHGGGIRFDSEDARIMTTLTEFAACALHLERKLSK